MREFEEPLDSRFSFRAWQWLKVAVQNIADKHHRDEAEVARFLLARGVAAYERDKLLIEPEGNRGSKR